MIELYTAPTPNGHKASCTLEALALEYNTHTVNIGEGDQHKPEFRAINPNGRIPAIIDRYQNECRRLFEVLDTRLGESEWLPDDYSIADIANWCWARTHKRSGVSIDELDSLQSH